MNGLKHLLTMTPILKFFDPFKNSVVCTDTCKDGIGGVLIKENYVIAYDSRKLKEHKNNYVTRDLKLAPIIHEKEILIRRIFLLMPNNISLN